MKLLLSTKYAGIVFVALFGLLSLNSARAELLNFDFTIVGDPTIDDPSTSYFAGTVTGELIGLQNNASSTPSDVVIFSAPAALNLSLNLPYSFAAHGWTLSSGGTLTVTNGVVTSALDYGSRLANPPDEFYLNEETNLETPGVGVLNGLDIDNKAVANLGGFTGVTYTPAAVPEPSSWAIGCLAALAFWCLRARRRAAL